MFVYHSFQVRLVSYASAMFYFKNTIIEKPERLLLAQTTKQRLRDLRTTGLQFVCLLKQFSKNHFVFLFF